MASEGIKNDACTVELSSAVKKEMSNSRSYIINPTEDTQSDVDSDLGDIDYKCADYDDILDRTMWMDLQQAIYDVRLMAPLFALVGMLLAYHLTIAPYRTHVIDKVHHGIEDLAAVRPMLSGETLYNIQQITLRAETQFVMPPPVESSIKLRLFQSVSKHGNRELPELFYQGVMFGITSQNSHNVQYSADNTEQYLFDLKQDLLTMSPKPTYVLDRSAACNNTDWSESGFGVYFSYEDLQAQGMLSSDVDLPWKRIKEDVLTIARKYKQVYVTVWYPHTFGSVTQDDKMENSVKNIDSPRQRAKQNHRYESIIQLILPTRTGLDGLKSTSAVWLSAVNFTLPEPLVPARMYRRMWEESSPYSSLYRNNNTNYDKIPGYQRSTADTANFRKEQQEQQEQQLHSKKVQEL